MDGYPAWQPGASQNDTSSQVSHYVAHLPALCYPLCGRLVRSPRRTGQESKAAETATAAVLLLWTSRLY